MNVLTIAGTSIRQDQDGRYCLNDLHRAAVANGANERTKEPAKFFSSPQTAELVQELTVTQNLGNAMAPVNVLQGGSVQGTFVVKELVYAYAMWISPAFHLKVIRAYDALVTAPPAIDPMKALNDPATMRALLLGYSERVIALESAVQAQAPKVEALERLQGAEGSLCIMDAAKGLKQKPKALFTFLQSKRWIFKRPGCAHWLGYQDKVQAGLLEHKTDTVRREDGTDKIVEQVRITSKGMARLAAMLNAYEQAAA